MNSNTTSQTSEQLNPTPFNKTWSDIPHPTHLSPDSLRDELRVELELYRAALNYPFDEKKDLSPMEHQVCSLMAILTPTERHDYLKRLDADISASSSKLSPQEKDDLLPKPDIESSSSYQRHETLLSTGGWQTVDQEVNQAEEKGVLVKTPRLHGGHDVGYTYTEAPLTETAQSQLENLKSRQNEGPEERTKRIFDFIGNEFQEASEFGLVGGTLYLGAKGASSTTRQLVMQTLHLVSRIRRGAGDDLQEKGIHPVDAAMDCTKALVKNTIQTGNILNPHLENPAVEEVDQSILPRNGKGVLEQQIKQARHVQNHLEACLKSDPGDPFKKAEIFTQAHEEWDKLQILCTRAEGAYRGQLKEAVPGACAGFRSHKEVEFLGECLDHARSLLRDDGKKFIPKEIERLGKVSSSLDQFLQDTQLEAKAQRYGFPGLSKRTSIDMVKEEKKKLPGQALALDPLPPSPAPLRRGMTPSNLSR